MAGETASTLAGELGGGRRFQTLYDTIEGYKALPDNWDTYGGTHSSRIAADFAKGLLRQLSSQTRIAVPKVVPISDGVYIEWVTKTSKLYFEVDSESVLFSQRRGDRAVFIGEDPSFDILAAAKLVSDFHAHIP